MGSKSMSSVLFVLAAVFDPTDLLRVNEWPITSVLAGVLAPTDLLRVNEWPITSVLIGVFAPTDLLRVNEWPITSVLAAVFDPTDLLRVNEWPSTSPVTSVSRTSRSSLLSVWRKADNFFINRFAAWGFRVLAIWGPSYGIVEF